MTTRTAQPVRTAYTPAEVAATLRVTERFVRKLCERGDLGHERHGNRYVIPRSDLKAYMARCYRPAASDVGS